MGKTVRGPGAHSATIWRLRRSCLEVLDDPKVRDGLDGLEALDWLEALDGLEAFDSLKVLESHKVLAVMRCATVARSCGLDLRKDS